MMFRGIDESANLFRKFNQNPTYYYHYAHKGTFGLPMVFGVMENLGNGNETVMGYFVCFVD